MVLMEMVDEVGMGVMVGWVGCMQGVSQDFAIGLVRQQLRMHLSK